MNNSSQVQPFDADNSAKYGAYSPLVNIDDTFRFNDNLQCGAQKDIFSDSLENVSPYPNIQQRIITKGVNPDDHPLPNLVDRPGIAHPAIARPIVNHQVIAQQVAAHPAISRIANSGYLHSIGAEAEKIYNDIVTKPTGVTYRDFYASNPQDELLRDSMTYSPFFNYAYGNGQHDFHNNFEGSEKNTVLIFIVVLLVALIGWKYWKEPNV